MSHTCSEIFPFLYLCGCYAKLPKGVTHIFSIGEEYQGKEKPSDKVHVFHYKNFEDLSEMDITPVLATVCPMIEQVRLEGGIAYVHCMHGQSRSPRVVIGYMCAYLGYTFDAALNHVDDCRDDICVWSEFRIQLEKWLEAMSLL